MREIRFRAWDKKRKEMIYNEFHLTAYGELISFGESKSWELMQFTGLHDKKGKEIWEGDIVHVEHREWDEYWTVEYDEGEAKFIVFNQLNSQRDFISINPKLGISDGGLYVEVTQDIYWQPEVIGNIYENPELVK